MSVGFLAKTATLARKDLRIEARARDTLTPMAAFALAVTLLLAFTIPGRLPTGPDAMTSARVLAGFFWITVLFAGLIGFARTFEIERRDGAIDSLLLVPLDRSGLFLAKAAANLVYIALVQALLLPAFTILFSLRIGRGAPGLLLVLLLVDLGFVAVGTLFSALAAQTRSRELMLPILALPALVPVFIAAVELTAQLVSGGGLGDLADTGWFVILLVFDVVFGVVAALSFEFVLD